MMVDVLGRWLLVLIPITACSLQKDISGRSSERSSATTVERDGRCGGA